MKDKDNMCRIPVQATYRIVNGQPVLVDAVYKDIPAEVIARRLMEHSGLQRILAGGDELAAE